MDGIVVIAGLLFILLALFGNYLYRIILNPITVFCGIWGGILLLYSLHAYGLYDASDKSLFLIISGVLMFFFGGITCYYFTNKKTICFEEPINYSSTKGINYQAFLILNALSCVFLLGFGITVIGQLLSGKTFYYIHMIYNSEEGMLGASAANRNIVTWFVWPLLHASFATLSVSILYDRTNKSVLKKWCFIITLANLALFTIISGKRTFLVNAAMYFVAAFALSGKRIKLKGRTKFLILLFFAGVLYAFNYISVGRNQTSILQTIYFYLVGCIPHLSVKLENYSISIDGMSSIYGFYYLPMIVINRFLHLPYLDSIRISMSELNTFIQQRVTIGPGVTFNAFLSPFFYFYKDAGYLGNFLFSFIFGFLTTNSYKKYLKKRSLKTMTIYLVVFFSLYMSFVRIQFLQVRYVLAFLYVIIIFSDSKVRFRIRKRKNM